MGLMETLGRIPKILESNINDLLDKAEDPVKMMNQLIMDAKSDLADVKRQLTDVMAKADMAQRRLDENQKDIDTYMTAARNAAKQGQEADAKQLLAKKQKVEAQRPDLVSTKETLDANVETLRSAYDQLAEKIEDLEQRKATTEGKVAAASGQEKVNKTLRGNKGTKAIESFERYEQKADERLARAQAAATLDAEGSSTEALAAKYSGAGNAASVDEEYAKLMSELNA